MKHLPGEEPEPERKKKARRDKGVVLMTRRDQYCLGWIADQYAVRFDQIQQLLSRVPGGKLKDKRAGLAPTTVKDQIERWRRAGWIEYQRVLVNQSGWAWITKKGLQVIEWDGFYVARAPAYTRLGHIYAVNQVRLMLDLKFDWKPEREYRAELENEKEFGPIPDAIISSEETGVIAVEVELTPKRPDDLRRKLAALTDCYGENDRLKFPVIWFYVPNKKMEAAVERAREHLIEEDQKRVKIGVQPDMIA